MGWVYDVYECIWVSSWEYLNLVLVEGGSFTSNSIIDNIMGNLFRHKFGVWLEQVMATFGL